MAWPGGGAEAAEVGQRRGGCGPLPLEACRACRRGGRGCYPRREEVGRGWVDMTGWRTLGAAGTAEVDPNPHLPIHPPTHPPTYPSLDLATHLLAAPARSSAMQGAPGCPTRPPPQRPRLARRTAVHLGTQLRGRRVIPSSLQRISRR